MRFQRAQKPGESPEGSGEGCKDVQGQMHTEVPEGSGADGR